jgi:lipid II:glycine glycyltransferase (peptidoglycan interpeptide bridge formation enzyme)
MDKTFQIMVDGQTRESWSDILSQFADASIYQSWAYGAVRWGVRNLSHLVMLREGQIVAAAQIRIVRLPLLPGGIAYLRWGPVCHLKGQALDPVIVTNMVAHLRQEYCERRALTLQVIPNAYSGDARGEAYDGALVQSALRAHPNGYPYRTVVVDLTPAAELIRKRLHSNWRNHLNRSEKSALSIEVSDGHMAYREFMRLYEAMWKRKRFDTSVDVEQFGRIQELLSDSQRMQTLLAKEDGQSIAAVVCSLMGKTAIYLLGATNERARELNAAYFLQWQAMLWLKDRGAHYYDLGGINPQANPGVHHFKSGFGGNDATQLPLYSTSGGALADALFRGFIWLRRRRASFRAPVQATR